MTADSSHGPEGAEQPSAEDDPFAYLYRTEGGEPEAAPGRAPGVPRTSYTRPMEVGRAQYGAPQQQHQQGGYPPPYGQQQRPQAPYGPGPDATAQLPNQQSRYAERSRPQPGEDAPRGRGKGPVIGVVAVVAAIAIGSGIALSGNDGKSGRDNNAAPAPATSAGSTNHPTGPSNGGSPSAPASGSPSPNSPGANGFTFVDGSKAQAQGAAPGGGVKGAVSSDGGYLTLQQGSSATWTFTAPTAGQYKFWLHYNNSGGVVKASVSVNGQDKAGGTTFKNSNPAGGDPYWSYTNVWPDLQAGSNTITVSVPAGGPVLVDQVALTPYAYNGDYPTAAPGSASS